MGEKNTNKIPPKSRDNPVKIRFMCFFVRSQVCVVSSEQGGKEEGSMRRETFTYRLLASCNMIPPETTLLLMKDKSDIIILLNLVNLFLTN